MARDDLDGPRHWKTGTIIPNNGKAAGTFESTLTPLERFKRYCQFDATTGCVIWTGGTTQGRGKSAQYGAFWFEGKRWAAHRWSAKFIHGLDIEGMHVDHCCDVHRAGHSHPLPPNTLCVDHVQAMTNRDNVLLQHERRNWILTQKGYLEPPPLFAGLEAPIEAEAPPFYLPPAWLGLDHTVKSALGDSPF